MTTNTPVLVAMMFAVGAGVSIALQSTIISAVGGTVGPVRTAFWIHVGGVVAGAAMVAAVLALAHAGSLGEVTNTISTRRMILIFVPAGAFGMITLAMIAVAFPRTGLVAGQLAIIGGQTLVALTVDTFGLAGGDPIPLDRQRLVGLGLMIVAAYLLIPRQG